MRVHAFTELLRRALSTLKRSQQHEEELGDIPDEFLGALLRSVGRWCVRVCVRAFCPGLTEACRLWSRADPITCMLMSDPVLLPTSKKTVDRSTIQRHLLSDPTDPFSRQRLSAEMLQPDEALRQKIVAWKSSKSV